MIRFFQQFDKPSFFARETNDIIPAYCSFDDESMT
jgi:hypothetical protein